MRKYRNRLERQYDQNEKFHTDPEIRNRSRKLFGNIVGMFGIHNLYICS